MSLCRVCESNLFIWRHNCHNIGFKVQAPAFDCLAALHAEFRVILTPSGHFIEHRELRIYLLGKSKISLEMFLLVRISNNMK